MMKCVLKLCLFCLASLLFVVWNCWPVMQVCWLVYVHSLVVFRGLQFWQACLQFSMILWFGQVVWLGSAGFGICLEILACLPFGQTGLQFEWLLLAGWLGVVHSLAKQFGKAAWQACTGCAV